MNDATRRLLERALELPEDQRAALAEALLASLPADEDLWEELNHRRQELADGQAGGTSWHDLRGET